jgi:16S rRNA (guanine(966)-N(2))-methyltransferase RsmD
MQSEASWAEATVATVRVIAGTARGTRLQGPVDYDGTRPISDRAKEALMSILGARIEGANVLDLFAGVGNVGIELLSRGAAHATFVDSRAEPLRDVRRNLDKTRLSDKGAVVQADAFEFLRGRRTGGTPYDIVFAGPPQWQGLWEETAEALDRRPELVKEIAVIQCDKKEWKPVELDNFTVTDERRYGSVHLAFLSPTVSSAGWPTPSA